MKLEKIIIGGLIIAAAGGCMGPPHSWTRSCKQEVYFQESKLTLEVKCALPDEPSVEELADASDEYIQNLSFKKKYGHYGTKIISNLKDNQFAAADNLVRELAARLEGDPNPYAKQYLENIKNFSYEVVSIREVSTTREGRYLLNIPLRKDVFGDPKKTSESVETERRRVCPYRRTNEKIE
jgi:hypothetical protein